jgi:hypothetical protein
MAGQAFFYSRDDTKLGPFSARQLQELAAAGEILPTDTVWKEGLPQGVPANRVKNLFPVAPAETPPPPEEKPADKVSGESRGGEPAAPNAAERRRAREEELAERKPPTPPPAKPKVGVATAVRGAIVVSQDGSRVSYRKKCIKCNYEDTCRHQMPIRNGATRTTFFCPKCKKVRPVELQGYMK